MKDDLNERRQKWNTTKMNDDHSLKAYVLALSYMNAVTLGIFACLIICFDHEYNKIVIKVSEIHEEENNYNLHECCHSGHPCLPHHMLLKGKTMRIIK